MKIYFFSPINGKSYLLFSSMVDTIMANGHTIVSEIEDCDTVFFDWYSGLGKYNTNVIRYILEHRLNMVVFDGKDYGAMSKEVFDMNETILLHSEKYKKLTYFMRKMDKTISYPEWVFPYELTMYPGYDFPTTTDDELFNRPNDICFIGNTSPTRENITKSLQGILIINGITWMDKTDFVVGKEKISHDDWLNRHRQAKMYIEVCGGGFASERPYQLTYIAPQLRVNSNQFVLNDWIDGQDCVRVDEVPTIEQIQNLHSILYNKDKLYSIYLNGIQKIKTYYSPEYMTNYILSILKQNGIF